MCWSLLRLVGHQLIEDLFEPAEGIRLIMNAWPAIICTPLLQAIFWSLTSSKDACGADAHRAVMETLAGVPGAVVRLAQVMRSDFKSKLQDLCHSVEEAREEELICIAWRLLRSVGSHKA